MHDSLSSRETFSQKGAIFSYLQDNPKIHIVVPSSDELFHTVHKFSIIQAIKEKWKERLWCYFEGSTKAHSHKTVWQKAAAVA